MCYISGILLFPTMTVKTVNICFKKYFKGTLPPDCFLSNFLLSNKFASSQNTHPKADSNVASKTEFEDDSAIVFF
jgi:hypothetical protein